MTVSFHHHLRDGDYLVNAVAEKLAARGLKDLVFAPSALFPVHEPLVGHIERGVISHIEGSMNGPIGRACSVGRMKKVCVLRSHGGRARAIQDGDLHIDVAFIAAPAADAFGDANGLSGPSACGPLGFAAADALYADTVVVVTDNLVPFPASSVGDPRRERRSRRASSRSSATPRRSSRARRRSRGARRASSSRSSPPSSCGTAGLLDEPEFSFQAGAGGRLPRVRPVPRRDHAREKGQGGLRAGRLERDPLRAAQRRGSSGTSSTARRSTRRASRPSGRTRSTSRRTPSRRTTIT